jgi:protein TonB
MRSSICLLFLSFLMHIARAQGVPSGLPDSTARDTATNKGSGTTDPSRTFIKVELESTFPGGTAAWNQFLAAHFNYPKKAVKKNIQGMVVVQFIIDKDGSVIDVRAISGPEELREAAENTIKQSPRWSPAIQGGRKVKSYKKQPLNYKLEE